jgi:membrane fusion protein
LESMRSIFRPEVLEAQTDRWLGDINVATPVSSKFWSASLVGVATIAALFITFGSYTRREAVTGVVSSSAGVVRVRAVNRGDVREVLVKEGQHVTKGQPIVMIGSDKTLLSFDALEKSVEGELDTQVDTLSDSIQSAREKSQRRAVAQRTELRIARERLAQARLQLGLYEQEARDRQDMVSRVEPLSASGYVSGTQIRELKAQLSTAKVAVENQRATISSIAQEIVRIVSQLEIDRKRSSAQGGYVLPASVSGTIAGLQVKSGEYATDGQVLATIVPEGASMEVELQVPSESIGFVRKGTPVLLKYAAFPYQKFGTYRGRVSFVPSAPTFSGDQTTTEQPSIFIVKVQLDRQSVRTDSGFVKLVPGMAVSASVMLEKRRLHEWILAPIYSMPTLDAGDTE